MDLYDVMRPACSTREFTDEPVSDEALFTILDNARFASSGGNRQGWRVIIVRDGATKAALADLQVPAIKGYGGALTTWAVAAEPRVQLLLGIPPHVAVAAVIPFGRPAVRRSKLTRKKVEDFTTLDRWDGLPLSPPGP